ncbi:MmcQ/YjbR family DNA-binding protein [Caulobacter sp. SLTY]|uniref:MmcQ/YjbR family DNA-binding protein n=1 Tax=Caulobacter sp. SLTY TaxID=2683262 RepID=UPI001412031B|nr:MmcQ/YjbR family DNA-binding protein [Caulobacter sp. SLTY]NBB16909.1 MmcQ/YjbR family DNA-binding protein [Caulobacter sp. SLTY]
MTQDDIRALALSLPLAEEQPHFDRASFRVKGKIFATLPPGGEQLVLKILPEIKESLKQSDPEAVIPLPGGWDRGGWTLLDIERMDDEKLANLIRLAWRQVAPKTLLGDQ